MALLVKNLPAMWETCVRPWVGKIPWRRERLPTPVFLPGEFNGQRSLAGSIVHGVAKSRSDFHFMKARTGNVRAVHCSPLETSLCDHCFSDLRIRWKNCEKNSFLLQIDCSSV